MKLLPVFIGIFITFFIQFLYSGSFFKMFQVHNLFWDHYFQIPKTITDWSTESYGMNVFAIISVVLPSGLLFLLFFTKHLRLKQTQPISLFMEESRNDYLFVLSIAFFFGNLLFVLLTQGGT